jgi:CRP-like cAMP-binding protein
MRSEELESRRAALARSTLFSVLAPAEQEAVLSRAAVRRVARHGAILRRGDAGTGAFVIVSGRIRIALTSEEGREVTLGVLGPGETVGEMSILDGQDVSADAVAMEDCILLFVDRNQFLRILRGNPELCIRVIAMLSGRLRAANTTLEGLALLDLPARLGRLLLRLARDFGSETPEGTRIELGLSQHDLGSLIGASREKVNRQLREWEDAGVIMKRAGRLILCKPGLLAGQT